jgi:cytolysin-activating lysine-acyltransferase
MATDPKSNRVSGAKAPSTRVAEPRKPASAPAGGEGASNRRSALLAQSFSQTVAALMRDPRFRNLRLADLEWLVLPPLLLGQCRLVHAKSDEKGPFLPIAVALWASVSAAVDKRLSSSLDKAPRLQPAEWSSGNIKWLLVLAGDQRALPRFLTQLQETELKGEPIKVLTQDVSGKRYVRTLPAKK